jgi:hypothetical protein
VGLATLRCRGAEEVQKVELDFIKQPVDAVASELASAFASRGYGESPL